MRERASDVFGNLTLDDVVVVDGGKKAIRIIASTVQRAPVNDDEEVEEERARERGRITGSSFPAALYIHITRGAVFSDLSLCLCPPCPRALCPLVFLFFIRLSGLSYFNTADSLFV